MQAYHYLPQKYRMPPPRYLPPPTDNIPLSEDEVEADAQYIPSRLIGPLLDFEDMGTSLISQSAGDCIARLLTKAMSPAKPFIYDKGGNQMVFTTEIEDAPENVNDKSITIVNSEYSVEDIPPELGFEPLYRIDYRDPDVGPLKDINTLDLDKMSMMEVPQQWRDRGVGEDRANENLEYQPSYWRRRVAFLDARTPAFIQKVRDELGRRYIIMTDPHDPELKNKFLEALTICPMTNLSGLMQKGVNPPPRPMANLSGLMQKRLNARQRRVKRRVLTKVSHSQKKLSPNSTEPRIKTRRRKRRQTRKTRRGRK